MRAANLAVAVHPHLDYKTVSYERNGQKYISVLAAERIEAVVSAGSLGEGQYKVGEKTVRGSELEGLRTIEILDAGLRSRETGQKEKVGLHNI